MDENSTTRISLTLYLNDPLHRMALKHLEGVPRGRRTEYICRLLAERECMADLSAVVYENAVRALREYGGAIEKVNTTPAGEDAAGEIENNFFGFLSSLQEEGGDEN